MVFTVLSDVLASNIQRLSRVMDSKVVLPVFQTHLFELGMEDGALRVTASDGDLFLQVSMKVSDWSVSGGDVTRWCVHHRFMREFMSGFKKQPLVFHVSKDHGVEVEYPNGSIRFVYTDADAFPFFKSPDVEFEKSVLLPSGLLHEDLNRTSPFILRSEFTKVLSAVCLNFKSDGMDVVSTDRRILAKVTHPDIRTSSEHMMLLPPKPVAVLRSLLLNENGDVSVGAADGIGVVWGQDWCLSFRLLTDNYLRYNSVISRKCTTEVVVSKNALHDSIRRVLLMGDGIQRTVRMVTDAEKLVLSTVDRIQRKSAEEEVACLSSGPAVSIYLDEEGVCKMLQQFSSEKVVLKMKDASSPMLIVPEQKAEKEDFLMLIAPSWQ